MEKIERAIRKHVNLNYLTSYNWTDHILHLISWDTA